MTQRIETMTPQALRVIVEGAWKGIAPTYTHEQRFALAELERRAEALANTERRNVLLVSADRMASCVDALVRRGRISSRSPLADAALDYAQTRHENHPDPFQAIRDSLKGITL